MHTRTPRRLVSTLVALSSFAALSLASETARAQSVDHEYQTWLGLFAQGPITGRLFFQGDLHYRAFTDFTPYWILVRPGIGYQLTPGMFVTLGYAWTPSWPGRNTDTGPMVDEHRVWEQWQYEFPLAGGALKLQLRSRLEERWRPGINSETGLRFRQMVRLTIPFGANSRWLAAVWDEIFFGILDTGWERQGFDQNRVFAGVGYQIVPGTLRVEAGYFNQYLSKASGPDVANHALMINTYLTWR